MSKGKKRNKNKYILIVLFIISLLGLYYIYIRFVRLGQVQNFLKRQITYRLKKSFIYLTEMNLKLITNFLLTNHL